MLKLTLLNGKIVLDPNIVLFKDLHDLYKTKRGEKLLQVIYYLHSRDEDNPFRNISIMVLEENVLQSVFNKGSWGEINLTDKEEELYLTAKDTFIKFNETPEARLEKSINKKLDEIAVMLDETDPLIEKSYAKSGEIKFTSNLGIILGMFTKVESIMKGKTVLQNAILKQEAAGKIRGGGTTSFRERGSLGKK